MTKTIVPLLDHFRASETHGTCRVILAPDRRSAHVGPEPTYWYQLRRCVLTHSVVALKQGDTAVAVSIDEYGLESVHVVRLDGTRCEAPVFDRTDNLKAFALKKLLEATLADEATRALAESVAGLFQCELDRLDEDEGNFFIKSDEKEIRERMDAAVVTWETREDGTVVGTLATSANALKPIETVYAGCRFRSRLEARYAVLLTTLGIEWEYEPEGYGTAAGWYLPDFRLPGHRVWLEIKPEPVEDKRHAAFAAGLKGGWTFIVAAGNIPDPRELDNPERDVTDFEASLIGLSIAEIRDAYRAARSARFEHGESP